MKKTIYVVRVVLYSKQSNVLDTNGFISECLRYAGIIDVIDNENVLAFDIYPPHGVDSSKWAEMNANRMKSFGFNAVKAPLNK